jgi:hypothetical protein
MKWVALKTRDKDYHVRREAWDYLQSLDNWLIEDISQVFLTGITDANTEISDIAKSCRNYHLTFKTKSSSQIHKIQTVSSRGSSNPPSNRKPFLVLSIFKRKHCQHIRIKLLHLHGFVLSVARVCPAIF